MSAIHSVAKRFDGFGQFPVCKPEITRKFGRIVTAETFSHQPRCSGRSLPELFSKFEVSTSEPNEPIEPFEPYEPW